MKQIIGRGAEAIIYKEKDRVVKHRVKKGYRHSHIDSGLRKFRTRREAKVLDKLNGMNFPGPKLINMDDKDMKIDMEFIEGKHSVPACYYEFAKRYPDKEGKLYSGFIAKSADKIFESTNFYKLDD